MRNRSQIWKTSICSVTEMVQFLSKDQSNKYETCWKSLQTNSINYVLRLWKVFICQLLHCFWFQLISLLSASNDLLFVSTCFLYPEFCFDKLVCFWVGFARMLWNTCFVRNTTFYWVLWVVREAWDVIAIIVKSLGYQVATSSAAFLVFLRKAWLIAETVWYHSLLFLLPTASHLIDAVRYTRGI